MPHFYGRSKVEMASVDYVTEARNRGIINPQLESLAQCLPVGAYIAGGFVAAAIKGNGAKTSDIDLFFNSPEAFAATYDLLTSPPKEASAWALQGYKATATMEEIFANSKHIKLVRFEAEGKLPIQLIKMVWYENAAHVIDSFDFTVTQFCIAGKDLIFHPMAMYDLAHNRIVLHREQYPADMLYRLVKYVKKGYEVSPLSLIQLAEHIRDSNKLDPPMLSSKHYE